MTDVLGQPVQLSNVSRVQGAGVRVARSTSSCRPPPQLNSRFRARAVFSCGECCSRDECPCQLGMVIQHPSRRHWRGPIVRCASLMTRPGGTQRPPQARTLGSYCYVFWIEVTVRLPVHLNPNDCDWTPPGIRLLQPSYRARSEFGKEVISSTLRVLLAAGSHTQPIYRSTPTVSIEVRAHSPPSCLPIHW